jgi:hypothetical protein
MAHLLGPSAGGGYQRDTFVAMVVSARKPEPCRA